MKQVLLPIMVFCTMSAAHAYNQYVPHGPSMACLEEAKEFFWMQGGDNSEQAVQDALAFCNNREDLSCLKSQTKYVDDTTLGISTADSVKIARALCESQRQGFIDLQCLPLAQKFFYDKNSMGSNDSLVEGINFCKAREDLSCVVKLSDYFYKNTSDSSSEAITHARAQCPKLSPIFERPHGHYRPPYFGPRNGPRNSRR